MCQWSVEKESGLAILIFAGKKGLVRVLDTKNNILLKVVSTYVLQFDPELIDVDWPWPGN